MNPGQVDPMWLYVNYFYFGSLFLVFVLFVLCMWGVVRISIALGNWVDYWSEGGPKRK